jgi:hypothetical protein
VLLAWRMPTHLMCWCMQQAGLDAVLDLSTILYITAAGGRCACLSEHAVWTWVVQSPWKKSWLGKWVGTWPWGCLLTCRCTLEPCLGPYVEFVSCKQHTHAPLVVLCLEHAMPARLPHFCVGVCAVLYTELLPAWRRE